MAHRAQEAGEVVFAAYRNSLKPTAMKLVPSTPCFGAEEALAQLAEQLREG